MGRGPTALRKAGLADSLGVTDIGDILLPPLNRDVVESGVKNFSHFKECTYLIYKRTRSIQTDLLIVVGGECSETVGAMAGASEAFGGKAGMIWMDAHGDFNTPDTSPSGYIGGMCLAMACGRTTRLGIELGRNSPPIAEERLVHIGSRALDQPEVESFDSFPVSLFTARQVKKAGAKKTAEAAARHLAGTSDWMACHLDLDVLDPALFPPVNYPTPDGLSFDDIATIIRGLVTTEKLRVVEIVAYNASKDTDGSEANKIVDVIRRALG
jgi:arginase